MYKYSFFQFYNDFNSLPAMSELLTAPSAVYSLQSSLLGAHVQRVPFVTRVESLNLTNVSIGFHFRRHFKQRDTSKLSK